MKWEVRKTESGKWGIFLNEANAKAAVVRMNKESDEAADEAG